MNYEFLSEEGWDQWNVNNIFVCNAIANENVVDIDV